MFLEFLTEDVLIVPELRSTSMLSELSPTFEEDVNCGDMEVVVGGTGEGEMVTPSSSSVDIVELQSDPTVRLDSGRPIKKSQ